MDNKQNPQQPNTETRELWLSMDSKETASEKMMTGIDNQNENESKNSEESLNEPGDQ